MISLKEKIKYQSRLPKLIKVEINESPDGGYFIKIISLKHCFTQADTPEEILIMVNDVVYSHFDIPEKLRSSMPPYFPKEELKKKLQEWEKAVPVEFLDKIFIFTQNGALCNA